MGNFIKHTADKESQHSHTEPTEIERRGKARQASVYIKV